MSTLPAGRHYAEITASTQLLAALIDRADLTRPVPTCPDWTLRQLATHVGRAQRWAAEIVRTRSAEFIPFASVPDGRIPDDPAQQPQWLIAGAGQLIGAVQEADGDRVWAFGAQRPAGFWARRMAHETAVHRADAQLAAGQAPVIDADVAADGIDEWLTGVMIPDPGAPDPRLAALGPGQSLHVHVTDADGEWLVGRDGAGLEVRRAHGRADVAVRGPASTLLLVLVRRLPPDHPEIEVLGDGDVLQAWLEHSRF
jgi:uncharacterized protein (TIGR03083 family)